MPEKCSSGNCDERIGLVIRSDSHPPTGRIEHRWPRADWSQLHRGTRVQVRVERHYARACNRLRKLTWTPIGPWMKTPHEQRSSSLCPHFDLQRANRDARSTQAALSLREHVEALYLEPEAVFAFDISDSTLE